MTPAEIQTRVVSLVAEVCGIESQTLVLDAPLLRYGLDSVRAVDLLIAIEDGVGVAIPTEDAELSRVRTAADLVALVQRRALA